MAVGCQFFGPVISIFFNPALFISSPIIPAIVAAPPVRGGGILNGRDRPSVSIRPGVLVNQLFVSMIFVRTTAKGFGDCGGLTGQKIGKDFLGVGPGPR